MKKHSTRLSFGTDADGNRIRKYFYYDTKAELNRQVEEFKKKIKISEGGLNFKDYAERWLNTYKSNRQPSTYNMYRHYIDMVEGIHDSPLYAISTTDIQEIVNSHKENPRTCSLISLTLKAVFRKALDEGKIERNPVNGIELPKYRASEKRILSESEKKAIEKADFTLKERLFVQFLQTYGLRPSEVLALDCANITKDFVQVAQSLGYDKHMSYLKETKTGVARKLPMTDTVYASYIAHCEAEHITDGLVFRDSNGNMMSKTASEKFKKKVMGKIMTAQGYDSHLTAYVFRHNKITELIYDGVMTGKISVKKVAQLMGNSEKMVMDVYSHIKEDREDVSDLFR